MRNRSAAGFRLILLFTLPLGRPRCAARISLAPLRSAYSMVGRVSRMRVSSVTRPSSESGTLKSTRMNTRWPSRFRSCMESFAISSSYLRRLETLLCQEMNQIAYAAGITPLVVVPGDDFHAVSGHHAGEGSVHNGGTLVAAVVH